MAHIQTACERLRSTPTPFTYTLLLHRTAWLFCLLLPFGLVGTLGTRNSRTIATATDLFQRIIAGRDRLLLNALCRASPINRASLLANDGEKMDPTEFARIRAPDASMPNDDNALLRRRATAEALSAIGFPVSDKTLATKATRGGGPPYRLFGRVPLYRWGDALAWAEGRLKPPQCSSSATDVGQLSQPCGVGPADAELDQESKHLDSLRAPIP
jgi:hypothetical protein